MADARADVLISLLDYLNYLDGRFGTLLRANRAQILQTERHVAGSFAQLAEGDWKAPARLRSNGRSLSRASRATVLKTQP